MSLPVTAYVIPPVKITDSTLLSCSVPEPATGEVLWNAATNYAIGDVVIRTQTHRKYKALVAGVNATPPENSLIASGGNPARWLDIGSTNRWAMFDNVIGTQTIDSSGHLVVEIAPGPIESLALLELLGQRVKITAYESQAVGAAIIKEIDVNIDGSIINSFYDWFYADYEQQTNFVSLDIPAGFWNMKLKIEVFGSSGAGIGVLAAGRLIPLGATTVGAGVGIINFGKVTTDDFGNREWLEGTFARRITLPIVTERSELSRIDKQLSGLRSTPAVYVGSTKSELDALVCYGVYRDFYETIPGYSTVTLNLEIDGLNNV